MKKFNKGTALALALGTVVMLSGCAKTMDCNVSYEHGHEYVTASGMSTIRNSEKEYIKDFYWTEKTVELNDEISDMTKFNLVKISGNEKEILEVVNSNNPYTMYEYKYSYPIRIGKVTTIGTGRKYGTNPNHSRLTGNMKDVTYKYHAYKIYTDEKGKRKVMKSPDVDDVFSIVDEYPYIKMDDMHTLNYTEPYTKDNQLIR